MTADSALKQSEQHLEAGNWEAAVQILNQGLQNRRIKGNNQMLERIMTNLIDICVANNSAQHIKDNLNHFRNTCQH